MTIAVKGLHHSAYRCRDAEETRQFYEDFLGLPLIEALAGSGFEGVVAVELGRHSHEGPHQARRSRDILRGLGVPFGGD